MLSPHPLLSLLSNILWIITPLDLDHSDLRTPGLLNPNINNLDRSIRVGQVLSGLYLPRSDQLSIISETPPQHRNMKHRMHRIHARWQLKPVSNWSNTSHNKIRSNDARAKLSLHSTVS